MARKQSRRCVSMNRNVYEAAKLEAERRGMTLAALVESGLSALGVSVVAHVQQTPELAARGAARRAESVASRQGSASSERATSRERHVLGDQIADSCGFA